MKNKILGLAVVTNNFESMKDNFLATLDNLEDVRPISKVLINFQGYTQDQIKYCIDRLEELNFDYDYVEKVYDLINEELVPITRIREDSFMVDTNLPYYVALDDDFKFRGVSKVIGKSAGRQYLEIAHYMSKYPKCGVVITGSTLIKHPPRDYIGVGRFDIHQFVCTGKGLFLKNVSDLEDSYYAPKDSLNLLGGREEVLASLARVKNGLYVAVMGSVRVTSSLGVPLTRDPDSEYHHWCHPDTIDNNVGGYIVKNYSTSYDWVSNYQNHYSYDNYLENGGLDVRSEEVKNTLLEYYPNTYSESYRSSEDLIQEIYEMNRRS